MQSLPPCLRNFAAAAELEAERFSALAEEVPPEYWPPWMPAEPELVRLVFHRDAPGLIGATPPVGGRSRSLGRAVASLAVALTLALSGCVLGPDGRRVLSPAGEQLLEQVLQCAGAAAATAATSGGAPDAVLLEASRCHLGLAGEQAKRSPAPSLEHGRLVLQARELEDAGDRAAAIEVARECDRYARGGR